MRNPLNVFLIVMATLILLFTGWTMAYGQHEQFYPPILQGRVPDSIGKCRVTDTDGARYWYRCEQFSEPDGTSLVGLFIPNTPFIGVVKRVQPNGDMKNVWVAPSIQEEIDKEKKREPAKIAVERRDF